jgi:hypothetical protein
MLSQNISPLGKPIATLYPFYSNYLSLCSKENGIIRKANGA